MKWLTISILMAVAAANSMPVLATPDGGLDQVAYSVLRPTNLDIYLFEKPAGDGSVPKPMSLRRQLTTDPALDYNPVFSPDERWVVFCSERRGNPDLYALDLTKGGPPKLLIDSPFLEDAPAFSSDGSTLAFVSTRDGAADIWIMTFKTDGSMSYGSPDAKNLTKGNYGNFNPAFSPVGKKIVFSSNRDTPGYGFTPTSYASNIYVIDIDASNATPLASQLTSTPGWEGSPAWSSDGKEIYFYAVQSWDPAPLKDLKERGETSLWRMKANGSDVKQISRDGVTGFSPVLSPAAMPDGSRVGFTAYNEANGWQIYSVKLDGSDQGLESNGKQNYWAPAFGKSGRMVCHGTGPLDRNAPMVDLPLSRTIGMTDPWDASAPAPYLVAGSKVQVTLGDRTLEMRGFRTFTCSIDQVTNQVIGNEKAGDGRNIIVTDLDGKVVKGKGPFKSAKDTWGLTWSKDGKWIAYAKGDSFSDPRTPVDICKTKSDGTTEASNLTNAVMGNNGWPDFSPDGKLIVFRSGRDGNAEIYLMTVDGGNPLRLTNNPANDTMPVFSPKGDMIAFVSTRDKNFEIYTLQLGLDGTPGALCRRTYHPGDDMHPRFSPDGKWLMFTSERGGINDEEPLYSIFNPQPYGEIWAIYLNDCPPDCKTECPTMVRLTHNKWEDGVGSWSVWKTGTPRK